MIVGVAAGIGAALTGYRIAGAAVALIDLAPALVLARVLALGVPPRAPAAEERVRRIIEHHSLEFSGEPVEVRDGGPWPMLRSPLSFNTTLVQSNTVISRLDDSRVHALLRVCAEPSSFSGAAGPGLRGWERTVYWLAFVAPAIAAGCILPFSVWLAVGGSIAAYVQGRTLIAAVNGHVSRRLDEVWAQRAGGLAMWADILEIAHEAALDTRRRIRGPRPLSWILAYLTIIPSQRIMSARVRALRERSAQL
jgi:hypothetical protein